MQKKFQISAILAVILFALVFLWLRENEARVAAETKLAKLRMRLEDQGAVQAGAITDLHAQLDDLKLKYQDAVTRYEASLADKDRSIAQLNGQARQAAQDHEAAIVEKNLRISDLEAKSRQDGAKFNASLKEKNTELSQLGAQLEVNSAKLSALLKQKESLESSNLDDQARIAALESEVARLKRHNQELLQANKNQQVEPVSLD